MMMMMAAATAETTLKASPRMDGYAQSPLRGRPAAVAPPSPQSAVAQPMNGANIILRSLIAEGVDTIFGYPGGVILPIYEALADYPELRHILVRHEQGGTHAAEGYARATGKPGVVMATSGPGATNLLTGLTNAYYDSTPIVAITGNVPANMLGNDAFQEADVLAMSRPCTKHNIIVRDVAQLASAIKEAFFVATTGRPGPVLVDIPKDVINAMASFDYEKATVNLPGYKLEQSFTDADVDALLTLLASAKRPVILAGGGVVNAGAHEELLAFAERFQIPVGNSLMGLGGFPTRHPLALGYTGMHGHYWANIAIANADVLIVAGNRLNERQTGNASRFARNAKVVHIDLDPSNLNKNVASCLPVQGCIKAVLKRTLERADMTEQSASLATRQDWFAQIEQWKHRRKPTPAAGAGVMTPQFAIERIFANLPDHAYVTTEVGQHQMWAAQRYNLDRPRSFITSGGLGTMGYGFPAAIGVQAAFPKATVVDIAGDGSFQMTLQELATAAQYNLPVKVCVINNSRLGMIRQWQGKMFGRESEALMVNPDYVKLAEAFGGAGFVVERPEDADRVLAEALAITDRPVIVDMRVVEACDVYPWVPAGGANEEMLEEES